MARYFPNNSDVKVASISALAVVSCPSRRVVPLADASG